MKLVLVIGLCRHGTISLVVHWNKFVVLLFSENICWWWLFTMRGPTDENWFPLGEKMLAVPLLAIPNTENEDWLGPGKTLADWKDVPARVVMENNPWFTAGKPTNGVLEVGNPTPKGVVFMNPILLPDSPNCIGFDVVCSRVDVDCFCFCCRFWLVELFWRTEQSAGVINVKINQWNSTGRWCHYLQKNSGTAISTLVNDGAEHTAPHMIGETPPTVARGAAGSCLSIFQELLRVRVPGANQFFDRCLDDRLQTCQLRCAQKSS